MNIIKPFFVFELKRRLQKREIAIVLALLLIFLFFVNQGKNKYTGTIENTKVFQETENRLLKSYMNYTQYGTFGTRYMFIPSPFSILYHNSIYDGLLSTINTGWELSIDKTLKGKYFFVKLSPFNDFFGLVLLCAAVFGVLYGYDTPGKKAYLRFISGYSQTSGKGTGKLFFALAFTRIVMAMLVFLLLLLVSLLWLGLDHINLLQLPVIFLILLIFSVMVFFFFVGFLLGTLKTRAARSICLGAFYVASFILFPVMLNIYTGMDVSEMESLFKFEMKNLELVMHIEKRLVTKFGLYKSGTVVTPELKAKIKESLNKEFKELFAREGRLRDRILQKVRHRHGASCLYPVLFFNTAVRELSSCGELSVIDFYSYCLQRKKEFLAFYVEKKFMRESRPGHVESFVKGDENLFYAGEQLPYAFWWGMASTLLYIFITAAAAYFRFNRLVNPCAGEKSAGEVNININQGEDAYIKTCDNEFAEIFCSGLPGHKHDYVYVCSPLDIPADIKVNMLTQLISALPQLSKSFAGVRDESRRVFQKSPLPAGGKRFGGLDPDERAKILFKLALLKDSPVYLFQELTDECSNDCTGELVAQVKMLLSRGRRVVYFSRLGYPNPLLDVDRYFVITKKESKYESKEIS